MKILILNGYSNTPQGKQSFKQFEQIVRNILSQQEQMIDTEVEIFICDRHSIVDFLYEVDSGYVKVDAGKNFDQIDMAFFEGDANMRPWSPNAQAFVVFLRMCLKSNKVLYAGSFAMQAIVFLCASNADRIINVINGLNGGQLGDISKLTKDLSEIRADDYFLDNVTGDLYGFNYETEEWSSKTNAGIHCRRAAEEYKTLGKYVIKAPQYKGRRIKDLEQLYISKSNETVCSIRKHLQSHYLLQGVPFEFMVPSKNAWDIHPFNFKNPRRKFTVLAENQKGPLLIEVCENIIATQFNVDQKYPETIKLLNNFVSLQLEKIYSSKIPFVPIDKAQILKFDNPIDNFLMQESKKKTSLWKPNHINNHQLKMNFNVLSKQKSDAFSSNAITSKTHKHDKELTTSRDIKDSNLSSNQQLRSEISLHSSQKQYYQSANSKKYKSVHSNQDNSFPSKLDETFASKNPHEIRNTLHPGFDKDLLPKNEHLWVPINQFHSDDQIPGQLSLKPPTKNVIRQLSTSNFKTRKNYTIDIKAPVMSCGSPYITQEEFRRQEERVFIALNNKKQEEKILAHKKFICNVPQSNFIPNYVTRTPSAPSNQHQFRSMAKQNWVSQSDFRLA